MKQDKTDSRSTTKKRVFLEYVLEAVLAISLVLAFTTVVLLIAGAPPLQSYVHIFMGSLGSWIRFTHVIKAWIPLVLCSCGLLYTFRIGLWNIGVEGQVVMGAIFTTALMRMGTGTGYPSLVLLLSCLAGMTGGALWALGAGYLRTKGGVHEIFAGLGLNFVAQGMVLWLIFGPWKRAGIASMSGTETFERSLWLPTIETLRISPAGIGIALGALLITAWMLRYTNVGLRLKAVGNNAQAAYLFGLRPGKYMLIAMILAGSFAGLAGSMQVTGVYHRLIPAISSNYGYLSLLVVMLANFNVWITPLVALFFACLNVGSIQLPMVLQLDSSLSGVMQGTMVLAALAVHFIRSRLRAAYTGGT
ncbi:MAG TPA: ABC transporter permease [Deltaproteobacteria bacterium]|nr:ABC transporter permease [Deltaproteobacteria bacterium]